MSEHGRSIWRSALSLLGARAVVGQIEVAAGVFVLFAIWLRVPDASAFDVLLTTLLALLILGVAGFGETAIVLRLCGRKRTVRLLVLGTGLLVAGAVLWFGWSALVTALRGNDALRAGYFNSQLPERLRYFFTYEHILLWLRWIWNALTWIGLGVILAAVVCGVGSVRPLRALGQVLRSIAYWSTLLLGALSATAITAAIFNWTPRHGLRRELLSLILRFAAVVLFDAIVVCAVLCVIAACCRSAADDAAQLAPEGTPDLSQPRTEGNP